MKRQEHLSDAEIEQCANNLPGACAEQIESHLSECGVCLHRLLEQQRIQFKSIEIAGMNRDPHPECYSDNKIQEVAAGMVEPEAAALILQHAAQCDHCGPLLNQYFEIFSEESSPEIEALLDQLPSSKPGWERKKASEIAAGMRPPAPSPTWWERVLRPRILATAGGLASLVIPMFIFGPGLLDTWQLKKEQKLVAVAYAKDRKMEMRLAIVLHGPMVIAGGTMGSNDGDGVFGYPEFNKARSMSTDKLSSGGERATMVQMKGELLLWKIPQRIQRPRKTHFGRRGPMGLDEPEPDIDLASVILSSSAILTRLRLARPRLTAPFRSSPPIYSTRLQILKSNRGRQKSGVV